MKYFAFVLAALVVLAGYVYAAHLLRQQFIVRYDQAESTLSNYPNWGFDATGFIGLQTKLKSHTSLAYMIQLPLSYKSDCQKIDQILLLAQQSYATTLIQRKTELDNRISYVRDRVISATTLSEEFKIQKLKELQDVSGTVFEHNPTVATIASASASTKTIDVAVGHELERIRKDALYAQLATYRMTCEENREFFREKNSAEGMQIADSCLKQVDLLSGDSYRQNGAAFLETLIGERIFSAVTKTDELKNKIKQEEIFAELERRKQQERLTLVPPAAVTNGKVVVVNIDLQRLYAYENGVSLFASAVPITTGKQGFETVKGEFTIYYKQMYFKMTSPFPGIYYDNVVTYWMPFYLGYGLHDAAWRTVYGTQDYPSVGSHGCVNIPFKEVAMLYNWAEVGTKVYVY